MMNTLLLAIALAARAEVPKTLLPEVPVVAECSLAEILRKRFLSGVWSATRRLEAARLRGDAEEVKRMQAALDVLINEAIVLE